MEIVILHLISILDAQDKAYIFPDNGRYQNLEIKCLTSTDQNIPDV